MATISAVVIVKNEEERIKACLESVKWVEEIVVIDDCSTDATVEVCTNYKNTKIYTRSMSKGFGPQKNYGLSRATGEWVLSIDADEEVSGSLKDEIVREIRIGGHDGYFLKRRNYMFGRWVDDYKPKNLRLFRRQKGSFSNTRVHETVQLKGRAGRLKEPLIHRPRNYLDIESAVRALDTYSSLMAQDRYEHGVRLKGLGVPFRLLVIPSWYFIKKATVHRSLNGGVRGLLLSLFSAVEYFLTYAKVWEKQHVDRNQG
ncbi:MAG: glycosyltransferase family 2 protein [Thermodesulfobacteriota bacterium]|nr:glycosyltransferase family 2 protein [Thermodesulfobacteriota bacterium]